MSDLDRKVEGILAREHRASLVSLVDGKHYSTYVERVKQLKRDGQFAAAEALLQKLQVAAEAEAQVNDLPAAPWYAEQLRIVRKKMATVSK